MNIKGEIFFIAAISILLFSCSKDDISNEGVVSYLTDYKENQNYTQIFYLYSYSSVVTGLGSGYDRSSCNSICGRLDFAIQSNTDSNFYELSPTREQFDNLYNLNKGYVWEGNNKKLKYYLVANIYFLYHGYGYLENPILKSEWKIVIGKIEEYVFNGQIFEHLIIVSDVK